jgi:RimJ/RimL family protein N-acetyltransferase
MKRLFYFRSFEESDVDSFYEWLNDENLTKMSVGLNRKMSRSDVYEWVKNKTHHNPYEVFWAVCANNDDNIVGYVSLSNIHYINRVAQFGGILIGNSRYQGGVAWIEIYQFVLEYVFEHLGMNRLGGSALTEHPQTLVMMEALFFEKEGVEREAVFKNGKYYNLQRHALLQNDYFRHKLQGDYEFSSILKRVARISNNTNK